MAPTSNPVTLLLVAWSHGEEKALDELMPLVYAELKRIARSLFRRERSAITLQPTALVHEAYLKLIDQRRVEWRDRANFFALSATLMRRILVDHARRKSAWKRGRGAQLVTLSEAMEIRSENPPDVLALDEALNALSVADPEQSRIVELRFFGGLSNEEAAEALGVSVSTVQRQFRLARAWLFHRLSRSRARDPSH